MKATITTAYHCCQFFIAVLLASGCNTKTNPQSSAPSFLDNYTMVINRPPAAKEAVQDTTLSKTAMLKKGYVYIGSIYTNYDGIRNMSEEKLKSRLLKEAARLGAEKAWVNTYSSFRYKSSSSSGGTYTSYSPGSSSYMKYGTGSTTTTVTYRPSYHSKNIKVVKGSANLYYYDPAVAAKQLNDAQKKWQNRIAAINEKRPLLIAKLERIKKKLVTYKSSSVHKKIEGKLETNIGVLNMFIGEFQTGILHNSTTKFNVNYKSAESYFAYLDELIKESSPLYMGLSTVERSEMVLLVSEVKKLANENWDVLCDFSTHTLKDQLLF